MHAGLSVFSIIGLILWILVVLYCIYQKNCSDSQLLLDFYGLVLMCCSDPERSEFSGCVYIEIYMLYLMNFIISWVIKDTSWNLEHMHNYMGG